MYLSIYINTWPDARLSSLVHYLRNTEIKIKSNINKHGTHRNSNTENPEKENGKRNPLIKPR